MAAQDRIQLSYKEHRDSDGQFIGSVTDASGRRREFKHPDRNVVRLSLAKHLRIQAASLVRQAEKIEKRVENLFGPYVEPVKVMEGGEEC